MNSTVSIDATSSPRVIKMTFQQEVNEADLLACFQTITQYLNHTADSLFVIVDIQARPNFLTAAIIDGALDGPFVHPKLENWLMIGHSRRGRILENVMASVTRRRNVVWFNHPNEVVDFLQRKGIEPVSL